MAKGKRGPRPSEKRKKKATEVKIHKSPRQLRLPETEDPEIQAIEDAALDYDDIKKQRVQLTAKEVPAKERLIALMHSEGKTSYKRGKISVKLVVEKEAVKVKVKEEAAE